MLEVTAAIIRRGGRVLLCQRPEGKSCAGLWEFPGGKIEPGETGEMCIVRECEEELGVTLRVIRKHAEVIHAYPDRTVHLHFFLCEIAQGTAQAKEHAAIRWALPEAVARMALCPADAQMLRETGAEAFAALCS